MSNVVVEVDDIHYEVYYDNDGIRVDFVDGADDGDHVNLELNEATAFWLGAKLIQASNNWRKECNEGRPVA